MGKLALLRNLGKVANIAADFVPGGTLVKTGIKLGAKILSSTGGRVAAGAAAVGAGALAVNSVNRNNNLPALPGGNMSLPALQAQTVNSQSTGGILPFWRGPGGKLQFPWDDPRVPQFLQQFAIDDSHLRIYYRAPKGFVIVKDPQGRAYGLPKTVAKQFGMYKEPAKPPISATDWKNYKRNQTIEKKLLKIAKPALKHHGHRSHTTAVVKGKKR